MNAERFFFVQPEISTTARTRDWSLRTRLMVLAGVATVIAWLAGGIVVSIAAFEENDQLHDARLEDFAHVILRFAEHEIEEIREARPGDIVHVETSVTLDKRYHYQVWSEAGDLVLVSADTPHKRFVPAAPDGHQDVLIDGVESYVYSLWTDDHSMQIQVSERANSREFPFSRVGFFLLAFFVVSIVALMILNWWMFGRATLAIDQSADQLLNRSPGDLRPIVTDNPPRELKPLLQSINCLFARFARALESEHNFSATAAHELRTPLAAVRVQAQVADRAHSAEGSREALKQLGVCVERASRTIDQLLTLARVESMPLGPGSMCRIQLDDVVRQVAADLQSLLDERTTRLDLALTPAALLGLEFGVASLVRNLLENAVRYCPRGGSVRVQTGEDGDEAFVIVEDSGAGVPRAERERVFEPFYRLESDEADGCGVGLSIVRSVVRVHRGRIELGDSLLGGLRAVVRFPKAVSVQRLRALAG